MSIGADMDVMRMAYKNLRVDEYRSYLCKSLEGRQSWSAVQVRQRSYFNSIVHEIAHAGVYTCDALGGLT